MPSASQPFALEAALRGVAEPMTQRPKYSITNLGVIAGFDESRAIALSDNGQVVGTLHSGDIDFKPYGFLWQEGRMSNLRDVIPNDINDKGQIVGPSRKNFLELIAHAGKPRASPRHSTFHWTHAMNEAGQVVGYSQFIDRNVPSKSKRRAFILEGGERRFLPIPDGYDDGEARGINNQAMVIGNVWQRDVSDRYAVVWQDDAVTLLGEPHDFSTAEAEAVNDSGQILVRAVRSNMVELLEQAAGNGNLDEWAENVSKMQKNAWEAKQQSYLWYRGQWQPIDGLALALNNRGQVVGWSGGLSPHASLWQNDEQVDINQCLPANSGWHLMRATDINNHGQIVGCGKYHDKTRAFLLSPIT